jgi:hypothetical protein
VPEHPDLDKEFRLLEAALRKLESEFTMFFGGQQPRPPLESRVRVERMLRRFDRAYIQNYPQRYRLTTLQARFASLTELWDRGLRSREEGRPGPFFRAPRDKAAAPPPAPHVPAEPAPAGDRVVCVTTLTDPAAQRDRLESLYNSLVAARQELGHEEPFTFQRFVQIVQTQVSKLREAGSEEVAFRVAVKDGKVAFTARGMKKPKE